MRIALFADVHANRPALDAVLRDIAARQVDRLVCLGDLVGYHAEPAECIARIRALEAIVVQGNHDRDVASASHSPGTHRVAEIVQEWTRSQLDDAELEYLRTLPVLVVEPGAFVVAHGSYLSTIYVTGYVTSTMLGANLRALAARDGWPVLAFCGHTHLPMCGWLVDDQCFEFDLTAPVNWHPRAVSVLVNPGSVGQPRDGDWRASYALVDTDERRIEGVRVEYDVDQAVASLARAGLPESLGARLRQGR